MGRSRKGATRASISKDFITDNLLKASGTIQHNKSIPACDEDISPTVERLAVLRWLELIDSHLPMLVARTFVTDLQTGTLKDLQPLIANAMDSLLEQLQSEDTQVCRLQSLTLEEPQIARLTRLQRPYIRSAPKPRTNPGSSRFGNNKGRHSNPRRLFCNYCQGWNRPQKITAWLHVDISPMQISKTLHRASQRHIMLRPTIMKSRLRLTTHMRIKND